MNLTWDLFGPACEPAPKYLAQGAQFNVARTHRFKLFRQWAPDQPANLRNLVLWIMLNPSTADEHVLDPTLRRCEGYSRAWGHSGMVICNLFGLRATDPALLRTHPDPVGAENDAAIRSELKLAARVMLGWGVRGSFMGRDLAVARMLSTLGVKGECLTLTGDGQPGHPLYLDSALRPQPWP